MLSSLFLLHQSYEDANDPHAGEPERVVLINNIPLDLALPNIIHEEISNLGEVMRIKILHNNRNLCVTHCALKSLE